MPVVALKPVAGAQAYVTAPDAVKGALDVGQILGELTVTVGAGFTVTVVAAVLVHPFASVPVTVYVVVAEGLAVTDVPVVVLKPVPGVHEYVVPPVAVSVPLLPVQIVKELTPMFGNGLIVTVAIALPVQPDVDVPVTV